MIQKIEWYREVLDLEPNSRVFFPLAKLLAAAGESDEAISTLRLGISRHPDNIEARFLLIELQVNRGNSQEIQKDVSTLGDLFAKYPTFWEVWSMHLAKNPAMRDASLALSFFSSALQGKEITWAAVIARGLEVFTNFDTSTLPNPRKNTQAIDEPNISVLENSMLSNTSSLSSHRNDLRYEKSEEIASTVRSVIPALEEIEETEEEPFSLRTRSMAEVLAEQGDISGAIEIYNELLVSASDSQKKSLRSRMEELQSKAPVNTSVVENDKHEDESVPSNTKLVSLLESLANRLEARAHN